MAYTTSANPVISIGSSYDSSKYVLGNIINQTFIELVPILTEVQMTSLATSSTLTFGYKVWDSDALEMNSWDGSSWIVINSATAANLVANNTNGQTVINISGTNPPAINQILVATSPTTATWQNQSGGGGGGSYNASYTALVGDGTSTTLVITHSLGTELIIFGAWEATGTLSAVDCGVTILNSNQISLEFTTAPASNSIRVIVISAVLSPGSGTVTSVSGTGTVDGLTLSGLVTSSGNLTLSGAITGFEPSLGNPSVSGYVLSSTTGGIRSWVAGGSGGSSSWGSITGTLSSQTDLQSALNSKQASLSGTGFVKISGSTISYDNSTYYLASNPNGYTNNTGTVTSVSGTGTVSGLTLSGSITTTGSLTLSGTITGFEPSLGNPSVSGYVLSSTTGGVRSWVANSGGTGTVTSVSTAAANNGITATWATATTTPALTIGLGNITPTSLSTATITDTSMTQGSILFSGTGGLVSQDNGNLFYNPTGYAGMPHLIYGPSSGSPNDAAFEFYVTSGVNAHFHNLNTTQSINGGVTIELLYTPTGAAVTSGNRVGSIEFGGTYDTSYDPASISAIRSYTTQTLSSGSLGGKLVFQTVPNGSTTLTTALTLNQDQTSVFASSVTGTSFNSITGLGAANPLMDGSVSVGSSTLVSRQDHVHPSDTTRQVAYINLTSIGLLANAAGSLTNDGSGNFSYVVPSGTGTVTSVSGTGTVSGLTLSGSVTTSGSLTLSGAITGFEPSLGNPSVSGYVLSSTTGGVRSWVAQSGSGTTGSGAIVQTKFASLATLTTGTTTIPADNTIPQITEGTEVLTVTITPTASASTLMVEASCPISANTAVTNMMAVFRDAGANALGAAMVTLNNAGYIEYGIVKFTVAAGSTTSTTFRLRIGAGSGTWTINGGNGIAYMGGVMATTLTVYELL